MPNHTKPRTRGFSAFRSAFEEAEAKKDNEGGHMSYTSGRIVQASGTDKPFKAIMSQEDGRTIEREFATMRDAEAFVRRNTPRADERSTLYDRDPDPS